ncbi:MAG: radical SAM protein [Gemmatimonadetes bacterium]|nr:radical SAM protein [Gemmatimonadota bacterium]
MRYHVAFAGDSMTQTQALSLLDPHKFQDPDVTADGEERASVALTRLETLWFNTGTLCNLECVNCYIESSPRNDRLVYLTAAEVAAYLDEIERDRLGTHEIGFTGGEPFMNPEMLDMLGDVLERGFESLVLTNAMRPMMKCADGLLRLREVHGDRLTIRVSIDHYEQALHEEERGERSWAPMIKGLRWLSDCGFRLTAAGRTLWGGEESELRTGFARLFADLGVRIDAADPSQLVIFPEMNPSIDVPEITTGCWDILGQSPDDIMCASSRMVIKHKGADSPVVLSCTLLPYDAAFEMGQTLAEAWAPVKLNHPHCAQFCVLGGASCSA